MAALVAALVGTTPLATGGSLDLTPAQREKLEELGSAWVAAAQTAAAGSQTAATEQAVDGLVDFLTPGLGDDAPDWLKYSEFDWRLREDNKPEFSLQTVQRLFQTDLQQDTLFTQLRATRNYQFGDGRVTTNAGLAYRRLLAGNRVLLGANAFFDYEWDYDHARLGYGVEGRWHNFDLYANYYDGRSGTAHEIKPGVSEKPLDGYDTELSTQLPYMPWAYLRGRYFKWQVDNGPDVDGWSGLVQVDMHQNLRFELGVVDESDRKGEWFLKLRFVPSNPKRPVLLSRRPFDTVAFRGRDMSNHTLDQVRRENNIRVQRRFAGGMTVSRGS